MPKVSIIINCHNGEEFLRECLDSIQEQSFKDYEIIFWDNLSTDKSAEIAKSYNSVRYYRGEEFVPLGAARNLALEKAEGDYIAFIDSDDLWDKEKLKLQVYELDNNEKVGIVMTNYIRHNMLTNKSAVTYDLKENQHISFSELVIKYHFCLSSIMVRKKALVGLDHLFNDQFKYAEEFELFSRVAYKWATSILSQPLVTYRIHRNMNTMTLQDRKAYEYGAIIENLRKAAPDIERDYPEAMKWIAFNRDFNEAKSSLRQGKNKDVRKLMRPYLSYNKRAIYYYFVALLPAELSQKIEKAYYRNRY